MLKFVNMTPHAIVLQSAEGERTTLPPSGELARVETTDGPPLSVVGLPVPVMGKSRNGDVAGLPAKESTDTMYVVSAMVLAALPDRGDIVAPATGPTHGAIRDEAGRIVAVTRLLSNW